MPIHIDRLRQDFSAIGAITATPGSGATRPTFSSEWGRAVAYVVAKAEAAGCHVRIDAYGNVHARQKQVPWADRVWLCGSHLDTVPHGGDYDGVAGVLVALELLRSANDEGRVIPLELIVFAEEEGPTFGLGMLGARAWAGDLHEPDLAKLKNAGGQTYLEAGKPFGVDPARFQHDRLYPSQYLGLLEVHIEQGPGMWRRGEVGGQTLAVVRSIAGRKQYRVTVLGDANHAGATSMADRNDALVGAAEMVTALEAGVRELAGETVLTVGRLTVTPNAVNVIPSQVEFTIDFRAPDDHLLRRGDQMIKAILGGILQARDKLKCQFAQTESIGASPMNPRLVKALASGNLPINVSGALHDSAILASRVPTVMLFVPSRDGISHNPAEFSRVEDVAAAASLLEKLVRRPLLRDINAMDQAAFVGLAGRWYEHSSWVAERAWPLRPFHSAAALAEVMSAVVRAATPDEQLALIRAHPDLVGKMAREGGLTRESATEQTAAGLTALSDDEIAAFETHNAAYHAKFGFPFVICARHNKKASILSAFPERLGHSREAEIQTALAEIDKIAALRMADAVWDENAG